MNQDILWLLVSNSTCFCPYLSNALENEVFKTMQTWVGSFKDTSVILSFYVMQAVDVRNKE